ncbi:MAG: NAD(+) diphosphatase [Solirubrobacteraceae bacterium]
MAATDDIPADPTFTQMALDRASTERKDAAWVQDQRSSADAVTVLAGADGVLVAPDGAALARAPLTAVPATAGADALLLGLQGSTPVFGVDLDALPDGAQPAVTDGARLVSLRDAGAQLPADEAGLAAYVVALLNWHRRHRFCANCGTESVIEEAGYVRHCPNCGAHHFPRTDPVVIMTVEHAGRMLLGRRTGWPPGRLSVLAGFVSPGESAEEAVLREVQEESGVIARDPRFIASQPWPFPASLMLGFHAQSDGGDPVATDGELEEVHWIERDEVRAAAAGGETWFALPPPVSIARFLIDRWLADGA